MLIRLALDRQNDLIEIRTNGFFRLNRSKFRVIFQPIAICIRTRQKCTYSKLEFLQAKIGDTRNLAYIQILLNFYAVRISQII